MYSKLLNKYKNGNYNVYLFVDGTKIRITKEEEFIPKFPESIDLKITNQCDKKCLFCHENSTPEGKHCNLKHYFLNTIKKGTELAIGGGNPLSHPDLINFLIRMQTKGVICNLTINQYHLFNNLSLVEDLINKNLIKGIGISYVEYDEKLIDFCRKYKNSILHLINGIISYCDLEKLFDKNLKILILGYKNLRRGRNFYKKNKEKINENKKEIYNNLNKLFYKFEIVSFDNLALKQLEPKRFIDKICYDKYYMGDDGDFTMYVDLVKCEYSISSTSKNRFKLLNNNSEQIFKNIKTKMM